MVMGSAVCSTLPFDTFADTRGGIFSALDGFAMQSCFIL